MKNRPNYWFRLVSLFAPNYAMSIMRVRYMERVYNGAEDYPSSDWNYGNLDSSANAEIEKGQRKLIRRSRDLSRNNPYAKKAADVIVSHTVGPGIIPKLKGRNETETKRIKEEWKKVAETPLCDNELRNDFYALQELAMRTVVESGEVLAIKYLDKESPKIQLLEPDYIDDQTSKIRETDGYISGIKVDDRNRRLSYKLYKNHPGSVIFTEVVSKDVPANKVIHVYRQTRPGQLRGVPWCHAIIQTLKDFDDFQHATIVRQKIAACLVGVIKTLGGDSLLSKADRLAKRKKETRMTPGTFKYAEPGEDVEFSKPPNSEGYGDFVAENIRAVACGYGITYESISNDYSKVNFSSGRMGNIEMRKNVESWRWNMFIPLFCDSYMDLFKEWCLIKGIVGKKEDIHHEWVAPAYTMLDPTKEIDADKEAVMAGFKSKSMVIRENGLDPDLVREEIQEEREKDKESGLNFDIYDVSKQETSNNTTDNNNDTDVNTTDNIDNTQE